MQNYEGIMRYLGKFYNCDPSVFSTIKQNTEIFQNEPYSKKEYENLVKTLKLKDENKKDNYISHNIPKLNQETCLEILSIITSETGYDKSLCEIFNVNSKLTYRLRRGLIYKEYVEKFN